MSKKAIKTLVPIGILVLIGLFFVSSYNSLVSQRETVNKANSKIEIALQRRYDLIPNIVNSTKGYMSHEKVVQTANQTNKKVKQNWVALFHVY